MSAFSTPKTRKIKFSGDMRFQRELRGRVDAYFAETGLSPRDVPSMYLKSLVLFLWWGACYGLLISGVLPGWAAVLDAIALGLAAAGIGVSVQHDAGHRAYSRSNAVNRAFFYALDFLGASSYVWIQKHNQLHHTYSNIDGHDDDLDVGLLGRLAPTQPYLAIHRFQHIYIFFLYGFLTIKWQLWDDWAALARGTIAGHAFKRPKGWEAFGLVAGKLFFYTIAFALPASLWGLGYALLFYFIASFTKGVTVGIIFQLAHCVEEAAFPLPDETTGRIEEEWAIHQIRTTVDFAPDNRLVTWYVGGLNFQIEHHLFPRICHIHYPALAKIVQATCAEYGVPYHVQPTVYAGIRSHFRLLRELGRGATEPVGEPALA